jgi:hypothetical protein
MKPQMNTKGSYTELQNWIQTRNISVKRTSGGLKYYQKIVKELDGKEPKSSPTGENIMDLIKNFNYSLNSEGKIVTKEKS